jgi:Tol biopolymer transport system component
MLLRFALRRGYRCLREGRWDDALQFFSSQIRRFPRSAIPHYEVGKLQFKKGDLAAARESFLAALDRAPGRDILSGILEVTNWWMVSSPSFYNTTPSFSPDGKKLVFCSARQDTNQDGKIDGTDRAGVYVIDIASTVVTQLISNVHHNASPQWSPDGQSILYFSNRLLGDIAPAHPDPKAMHLMLRDLESRDDVLLVPSSLNPRYPVFTPDGKSVIVCTVDTADGPSGISLVDIESQKRKPLTSHAWEHTYPQISRDGKSLLYVCWRRTGGKIQAGVDRHPEICLMNLETGKEKVLIDDRFSNAYPRFSPDAHAVVYLSRRRDTNSDGRVDHLDNYGIYTLRLSDRKETRVTSDDHYNKYPAWSPDGRWILFLGHWAAQSDKPAWRGEDYFEFKGLYRAPSNGGKPETIMSDKFFGTRFCEVSPVGSLVAYVSWRPTSNRGLYIADYTKLPTLDQLRSFIHNNLS